MSEESTRRLLGVVNVTGVARKTDDEIRVQMNDGLAGAVGCVFDMPVKAAEQFIVNRRFRLYVEEIPALTPVKQE